jgi:hypothetical protein
LTCRTEEHTLRIERVTQAIPGTTYPRLLEAVGHCPTEDIGGPWGYHEFLEALAGPDHEQHDDAKEWIGGDFDATDVGVETLTQTVDRVSRKWTRKPSAKRKQA